MGMTFGSRTLLAHLARGAAGVAALFLAVGGFGFAGWASLLLIPFALWMFRGCPMCWTIGLFETIAATLGGGKRRPQARIAAPPQPAPE